MVVNRGLFVFLLLQSGFHTVRTKVQRDGVVYIHASEQQQLLKDALLECFTEMQKMTTPAPDGVCHMAWDDIACWPQTEAGTMAIQPCPDYVQGFNITGFATRQCTEDGTWYFNSEYNKTWSNYSECVIDDSDGPGLLQDHLWRIELMYNVGYGLSLASLLLAIAIMLYFKRLHCARNTVHVNLFISFSVRAGVSFLMTELLVQGVGLPKDVKYNQLMDKIEFIENGTHWECKLLLTIFNYALLANYMWVFVEGLYLHMLIVVSVFSEKKGLAWYILLGWGAPLLFIIPWVVIRVTMDNVLCWNTHPNAGYFWIIKGPIAVSIAINFVFFLNILYVLFTKLKATNTPEGRKYRKLAKSTLVLIPLFGVHCIIFLALPEKLNPRLELFKLYFEMLFNSFQGFLVALLFCFLNGEVQGEIKKKKVPTATLR